MAETQQEEEYAEEEFPEEDYPEDQYCPDDHYPEDHYPEDQYPYYDEDEEEDRTPNPYRRKQSVWFVRYGLTEHPLVEDLGPYDSDIDPGDGIDHAVAIAKRIASGVGKDDNEEELTDKFNSIPQVVYASPFLRTAHTGYIIANELQKDQDFSPVRLRLEEGLWEWLIPSLLVTKADGIKTNPRPPDVLEGLLRMLEADRLPDPEAPIDIAYQSVNPYDDSGDVGIECYPDREKKNLSATANGEEGTPPKWIESEEQLLDRCETTLTRILDLYSKTWAPSICIVSHAPCDQAMAFCLEKLASKGTILKPSDSKLTPWPLGGITVFSREVHFGGVEGAPPTGFGNWTMELYGDTEHMPGEYKAGLKEWSLPCFSK